jgi:3-deoxy-D-manno-octulosonic-acid transferase
VSALYLIFIRLYYLSAWIASLWNKKASAWISGRKDVFGPLSESISPIDRVIWVHCASAGEFEQGKPLIEQLKKSYPAYKILVSFFSPSGYEVSSQYPFMDISCYLPLDTPAHAKHFLDIIHPSLVVFVKYDYWYYLLQETNIRKIPLLLISATFRKNQLFFRWYGRFYSKMLRFFTWIFVQDQGSLELLKENNFSSCSIAGDTRFDRVSHITETFAEIPLIKEFINNGPSLVA